MSISNLIKQKKKKENLQKISEKFKDQTFSASFEPLYFFIKNSRFLFNGFSIVTGSAFLFYFLENFMYWKEAAAVGAVSLLVSMEIFKTKTGLLSFTYFFKGKKAFSVVLLVFTALFFLCSFYLSTEGAAVFFTENIEKVNKHDLSKDFSFRRDSIRNYYNNSIEELKTGLKEFSESVSYRGKINIHNPTNKKVISSYYSSIEKKEQEKQEALLDLGKEEEAAAAALGTELTVDRRFFLIASIINEFLIVFFSWFLVYYEYNQFQEINIVEEEAVSVSFSDIQSLLNNFLLSHSISAEGRKESFQEIGFSLNALRNPRKLHSVNNELESKNTERDLSGLEQDILNGLTDYRTLTRKHSVNVRTVKETIEKLKR